MGRVLGSTTDPPSPGDARRVAGSCSFPDSAAYGCAARVFMSRHAQKAEQKVEAKEPVTDYDKLKTKGVVTSLSGCSQVELARIETY